MLLGRTNGAEVLCPFVPEMTFRVSFGADEALSFVVAKPSRACFTVAAVPRTFLGECTCVEAGLSRLVLASWQGERPLPRVPVRQVRRGRREPRVRLDPRE